MFERYLLAASSGSSASPVTPTDSWFHIYKNTGNDDSYCFAVDSQNGDIYVGNTFYSGSFRWDSWVYKLDSTGTVQWSQKLPHSSRSTSVKAITIDKVGVGSAIHVLVSITSPNSMVYFRLSKSYGTIATAQKDFNQDNLNLVGIDSDLSGNLYMCGIHRPTSNGYDQAVQVKFTSSHNLQWCKTWYEQTANASFFGSSNVGLNKYKHFYHVWRWYDSSPLDYTKFCTLNESGNAVQYKELKSSIGVNTYVTNGCNDFEGNLYIVLKFGNTSTALVKLNIDAQNLDNSLNTGGWARELSNANYTAEPVGVAVDALRNVYVLIRKVKNVGATTGNDMVVAKYDSAGTLLFKRQIQSSADDRPRFIEVHNDSMYIGGYTQGGSAINRDSFFAKLPADGSGSGTYGSFSYGPESDLTDSNYTSNLVVNSLSFLSLQSRSLNFSGNASYSTVSVPTDSSLTYVQPPDRTNLNDIRPYLGHIAHVLAENSPNYTDSLNYPYYYRNDGTDEYVSDGGTDIFDNANFTSPWEGSDPSTSNGPSYHPNRISYLNITNTSHPNVNGFHYATTGWNKTGGSPGQNELGMPLIAIGSTGNSGNQYSGWMKGGNSGADGSGTRTIRLVYPSGTTMNGFTVYAGDATTYGTSDASHCDFYIALGHPEWNSSFGGATPIFTNGGSIGTSYVQSVGGLNSSTQNNILWITMLLSERYLSQGYYTTFGSLDGIVNKITANLKDLFNY